MILKYHSHYESQSGGDGDHARGGGCDRHGYDHQGDRDHGYAGD